MEALSQESRVPETTRGLTARVCLGEEGGSTEQRDIIDYCVLVASAIASLYDATGVSCSSWRTCL